MRKFLVVFLAAALVLGMPAASWAADIKIDSNSITGGFTHPITDQEKEIFGLDDKKVKEAIRTMAPQPIQVKDVKWQDVQASYKATNSSYRNSVKYADELDSLAVINVNSKEPLNYSFKPSYKRTNTLEHSWNKGTDKGLGFTASYSCNGYGFTAEYPAGSVTATQSQTMTYHSDTSFAGQIRPQNDFKLSRVYLELINITIQAEVTYEVSFKGTVMYRYVRDGAEQTGQVDINELMKKAAIPMTQTITDTITVNIYSPDINVTMEDSAKNVRLFNKLIAKTKDAAKDGLVYHFQK